MSESTQREEALFDEALVLPAVERPAFLVRACQGDQMLRRRVEALLHEDGAAGGVLDAPLPGVLPEIAHELKDCVPMEDLIGCKVGHYKLLQKLGEGGCGVVLMAEQEEPLRRRVAVKVIKLGMDTKEVIARFEAERQALALMDHPNIARVLDAGATDSGRPYFVMELVRGIPITRFCDEHGLDLTARLHLFVQVCQAIQHAHHKGIVHRDLKPSNILVTFHDGVAVPKVIDFGIAKATQGRLTDRTLFTSFGQFIGTPAYMSPEQMELSGYDVDTRSDIYGLGVLLYELLTGCTPFDSKELAKVGLVVLRRTIREQEPPKPSTRVSTLDRTGGCAIAQRRATDPDRLHNLLRGDLDWIVMRCLEKERSRRYETANGLAMDIGRYLHSEPVVARPPSTFYLLRKLVRRNKAVFVGGCTVLATLVAGLIFSTAALQREHAARQRADTEATRSAQVARFMQDMLAGVGPQMALGRDTKMLRAILDETVERLPRELRGQPELEADLRETLGNVYRDLGEFRSATLMHETALQMRREIFGAEHVAVANALANLSETLARQDRLTEAETMLRDALAMREKLLGQNNAAVATTRAALSNVLRRAGKALEADSAGERGPRPRQDIGPREAGEGARPYAPNDKPLIIRLFLSGRSAEGKYLGRRSVFETVQQQGVLESEFNGDGIRIEWTILPSGKATNEVSSRGQVDFAVQGDAGAITGRAGGLKNRLLLVSALGGNGVRCLIVRADSPFRSLADFKGRRLGIIRQTAHHLAICRILEKNGLGEKDFQLVDLESLAAIQSALTAGEIDGHFTSADLEAQSGGRVIYDAGPDPDLSGFGVFWVSQDFERRFPAIVQRVVNALVKTAAWNSDERNRRAVFELWSKSGQSFEAIEKIWAGRLLKDRLSPLMDDYFWTNLRQRAVEAKHFGIIDTELSVEGWAEPKYLQRALRELKLEGYWPERDADGKAKSGSPANHANPHE